MCSSMKKILVYSLQCLEAFVSRISSSSVVWEEGVLEELFSNGCILPALAAYLANDSSKGIYVSMYLSNFGMCNLLLLPHPFHSTLTPSTPPSPLPLHPHPFRSTLTPSAPPSPLPLLPHPFRSSLTPSAPPSPLLLLPHPFCSSLTPSAPPSPLLLFFCSIP